MKSKSFNEPQSYSMTMHQNVVPVFTSLRNSNINRDFSNEQKIRRISPNPQERFSHLSNTNYSNIPLYPSNQYQLPIRGNQPLKISPDSNKLIQDLTQRIEKLEMKLDNSDKLSFRVQKLESISNKIQLKIDKFDTKSQDFLQGSQNRMNLQNCSLKNDEDLKQRMKNLITRQQLQRQLIGLDSAFKTLIKQIKSNTNLEMRDIHSKQKKAMIQVVASQISDKLEAFKERYTSEFNEKISNAIRENLNKQNTNKTIIGVSREKFLGPTIPIKVSEQLHYSYGGGDRQLGRVQTTYYIDSQGYILDSNLIYLVDKNNSKIKLMQNHIDILRKQGLLGLKQEKPNILEYSLNSFNPK